MFDSCRLHHTPNCAASVSGHLETVLGLFQTPYRSQLHIARNLSKTGFAECVITTIFVPAGIPLCLPLLVYVPLFLFPSSLLFYVSCYVPRPRFPSLLCFWCPRRSRFRDHVFHFPSGMLSFSRQALRSCILHFVL